MAAIYGPPGPGESDAGNRKKRASSPRSEERDA